MSDDLIRATHKNTKVGDDVYLPRGHMQRRRNAIFSVLAVTKTGRIRIGYKNFKGDWVTEGYFEDGIRRGGSISTCYERIYVLDAAAEKDIAERLEAWQTTVDGRRALNMANRHEVIGAVMNNHELSLKLIELLEPYVEKPRVVAPDEAEAGSSAL